LVRPVQSGARRGPALGGPGYHSGLVPTLCTTPRSLSMTDPTRRFLACAALALCAAAPAFAQSTLDKVKDSGSITLSYREASIPFSYLDDKAQPVGFGVDICDRIVDEVRKATGRGDLKVQRQAVTSANRIPLLVNGTIDLECGSTTNNSDRAKQVAFAINYFYTGTRFLVKADSGIKGLADLNNRILVSTTGTTNFRILRNLITEQKLPIELIGAKDHLESALLVESGRAAAFGMDDILLYGLRASALNPASLAVVGDPIQVEPYAIMLRKDDPAFKKLVDGVLVSLIRSGDFEKLYRKWFQSPIPPKGINLNAPMGKELTDNLKLLSDKPAT
jgi:glutamate/aspartate transport system substrate-binding protein